MKIDSVGKAILKKVHFLYTVEFLGNVSVKRRFLNIYIIIEINLKLVQKPYKVCNLQSFKENNENYDLWDYD